MDKQTIKGAANDALGSVKRAAGKVTGNQRLQAEGLADQALGKTQKVVGKTKDAARKVLNKH